MDENKVLTYSKLSLFLSELKKIFPSIIHNHDDRYFTEDEITSQLSNKANESDFSSHKTDITLHVNESEKTKWNNAEPNQNAFSNVMVGSATISATSKTDSLKIIAGSNIQINLDDINKKITISATDTADSLKKNHILFQETEPTDQDEGGIWNKTTDL